MALPYRTACLLLAAGILAAGCSRADEERLPEGPDRAAAAAAAGTALPASPAPAPATTAPTAPETSPAAESASPTPSATPADTASPTADSAPTEPATGTPAVPAMPPEPTGGADMIEIEVVAARLQARGLDPRSDPRVRALDFACFAHERSAVCSSYLAGRNLGTSVASARTYHPPGTPPDPVRPAPVLPPACTVAAAVPSGNLIVCSDDT